MSQIPQVSPILPIPQVSEERTFPLVKTQLKQNNPPRFQSENHISDQVANTTIPSKTVPKINIHNLIYDKSRLSGYIFNNELINIGKYLFQEPLYDVQKINILKSDAVSYYKEHSETYKNLPPQQKLSNLKEIIHGYSYFIQDHTSMTESQSNMIFFVCYEIYEFRKSKRFK